MIFDKQHRKTTRILSWICCLYAAGILSTAFLQAQEKPDQQADQPAAPPNTQPLTTPFTPPEEAVKSFRLPPGFKISLFAAEPDIQQPIAVTMDHKGRLWVVECYTYSDRKTNYDMTQKDRVVIFEDSDHDGRFDSRKVFWDQGEKLTGIEVGFGGVWLTSAPHFLFIPDADADDQPDGPPVVLLDGFEDDVIRHNIVNGLRWGHDGWLYGRHGIQATSFVGPPGATPSQRTAMNCSIWRFHPKHHRFELVAQGGTNPWGFDFDQHGEMFMINTVIGHLFHVVPGARYRRMYGAHFNPHTYQVIEQTADHIHFAEGEKWHEVKSKGITDETDAAGGGHAHTGLMIYLGDNWPATFRNGLFTANFHGRRINWDKIQRQGNGYVGTHAPDLFPTSDPWFRGVEMIYGPDGGVFLLDWSDIGECHENDGIHRTSGRIYKITYQDKQDQPHKSILLPSDTQNVTALTHTNEWYFRKFRRHIQQLAYDDKLPEPLIEAIRGHLKDEPDQTIHTLRAMWCLYSADRLATTELLKLTRYADEHVRSWAVRLLADGLNDIDSSTAERFVEMARSDASGLVRLYLASSLNRLSDETRLSVAHHLMQHADDANDRTQPSLIWFGIEPIVTQYPSRAIALAQQSKIGLVQSNIIRRVAFENENIQCRMALGTLLQNPSSPTGPAIVDSLSHAFQGWTSADPPPNWASFVKKMQATKLSQTTQQSLDRLESVFGGGPTLELLMKTARNSSLDALTRQRAIDSVARKKPAQLFEFLRSLANDKSILTQVIKSFVHCNDERVANVAINRFGSCDQDGKNATFATLTSRPQWAFRLLQAIENKRLPKSMLQAWHARKIHLFGDEKLTQKLKEVWGEVSRTSEAKESLIAELKSDLHQEDLAAADISKGRGLFTTHCANCHVMKGTGSRVGPDLTGSDRGNLNYLLENLVDPSALVAESYQMKIFLLDDGRTLSGVTVNENSKTVQIQTAESLVTVEKSSIEEQRKTKLSLMPEGLLDKLNRQQKLDLLAYLMKK